MKKHSLMIFMALFLAITASIAFAEEKRVLIFEPGGALRAGGSYSATPPGFNAPDSLPDFDSPNMNTPPGGGTPIVVDSSNNQVTTVNLGKNIEDSFGSLFYTGSSDTLFCNQGSCYFGLGIRAYFDFRFPDADSSTNSTDHADGFTFALIGGPPTNTTTVTGGAALLDISSLGELEGYAGTGTSPVSRLPGGGLQPPKMAIEVDTYPNPDYSSIIVPGSRRDPMTGSGGSFQNHIALMFWGENNAAANSSPLTNAVGLRCASNDEFVRSLYRSILGREAEPGGLAGWASGLNGQTTLATQNTARSTMFYGFFGFSSSTSEYSLRNRNNTNFMYDLYRAVLGTTNYSMNVGGRPATGSSAWDDWLGSSGRCTTSNYASSSCLTARDQVLDTILSSTQYTAIVNNSCGGVYNSANGYYSSCVMSKDMSPAGTWDYGCTNRDTLDDNVHFEGGAVPSTTVPLSPQNAGSTQGYDYYAGAKSGSNHWLEDNQSHRFRIEIHRSITANGNGKYDYLVKTWVDCPGSTCTDGTSIANNMKNVQMDFGDLAPQINRTVELAPAWHNLFDKYLFGWTFGSGQPGDNGQNAQISNFAIFPITLGCTFSINPSNATYGASAGSGSVTVTASSSNCVRSASVAAGGDWLTITDGATGSGSGTVTYSVAANPGIARTGSLNIAGQVFTVNQGGCIYLVSPTAPSPANFTSSGGSGTFNVTGCTGSWTATASSSTPGWLTTTSSGTAPGTGNYTVAANTSFSERTGTISVGPGIGQSFTVTQAGVTCPTGYFQAEYFANRYLTAPPTLLRCDAAPLNFDWGTGSPGSGIPNDNFSARWTGQFPFSAGGYTFIATADDGVRVRIDGDLIINGWVDQAPTEYRGAKALTDGSHTVVMEYYENGGGAVAQLRWEPCTYQLSAYSRNFGSGADSSNTLNVTTTSGCPWTAVSNDSWITIYSGSSGTGNGTVGYAIAANPGPPRTGTMTVAGLTFTVTQDNGCTYSVTSVQTSYGSGAGSDTYNVSTGSSCPWTTSNNGNAWITVAPPSNTGSLSTGTVSVEPNTGPQRSGQITIAGSNYTITQTIGCAFTISPTSQSFGAGAGSGSVGVTASNGACTWTATESLGWASITSGGSGTGNGTVNYTVSANTGPDRNGNMTIAGQTFTISQASGCSYSVTGVSAAQYGSGGGTDGYTVTTVTGCPWTTSNNGTAWFTITPASTTGTGSGTITVGANTGIARTGTATIARQNFTISQASGCNPSISPTSQSFNSNGGTSTVAVTAGTGCTWTASESLTWVSITSGSSGTGDGTVGYTVNNNTGAYRSGSMTIGGDTFTVNQARGCTSYRVWNEIGGTRDFKVGSSSSTCQDGVGNGNEITNSSSRQLDVGESVIRYSSSGTCSTQQGSIAYSNAVDANTDDDCNVNYNSDNTVSNR